MSRWVPDVYYGFGYQSINSVYYNGANSWPSLQDYFNKRLSSDTFGYGFPLVNSVSLDYHQKSYTTTSMFGCVHVYVYRLSDTLLTANGNQTINLTQMTTNSNNPRRVFTYLDLKLEGQHVGAEIYLKVTATLRTNTQFNTVNPNLPPPITFTYMTSISKTMIDANRPSGPGSDCLTEFMCSATTYTGYPLRRATGQLRNFEGDIVATFTIFPVEVENLPMDNFAAAKNNVDRYTRQMSTPFNLTDDGRYLYKNDVGSSITYTTTGGFDYDVRVRMFEFRHSLINYESFGLSYNTYNFSDYGYCLLPIPVDFRKDATAPSKCNNWNYSN